MNYEDLMLLAAGVAIAGEWSQGKKITVAQPLAFIFLAIFLAVIAEGNPHLANVFAALIVVGAMLEYGVPLGNAIVGSRGIKNSPDPTPSTAPQSVGTPGGVATPPLGTANPPTPAPTVVT